MTNFAIEQILSADEAARKTVEQAEQEAARRIDAAKLKAQCTVAELEDHLRETEEREILPIITAGHTQAQLTVEDAQRYIEALRQAIDSKRKKIIDAFIDNIIRPEM